MKRIFVTGAAGFIGKMLVRKLLEKGYIIYALIMPSERKAFIEEEKNLHIIEGNLDSIVEIQNELMDKKIDVIYHLAWVGVSTKYKNDFNLQIKNLDYALKIMQLAKSTRCHKVIITGSVSEYAYANVLVDGNQVPSPSDAYSATKASIHIFCNLFARQNKIIVNWILISSIYGPGRDDNNLISYCIKSLLKGEKPSFTRLEQKWDYIYITDVVDALVLVGKCETKNKTYCIGSGESKMLSEYVYIIRDLINPSSELGIGDLEYKTESIDNSIVDISAIMADTGFRPSISFEKGIKSTIEYFKGMVK